MPRGVPPQSVHYRSQTAPPQAVEPLTPSVSLRSPQRWLEYGRLAALPLAILPIPPDFPLAASPTGRARLESPARGDSFWLTVARQPRSSTQKFIVGTASEKKVRHLACFDDSDASDADMQGFTFSLKTVPISFRFRPRLCAPPPGPWEGRALSLCLRSRQL